jgi:hypothetical protein
MASKILDLSLSASKKQLMDSIREALTEPDGSRISIAVAAQRLNEQGITAPKGKAWTTKSLGKYISSNQLWLVNLPAVQPSVFTKESVIRGFIETMARSLGNGNEAETLLFMSVDRHLLEQVKERSSKESISVSSALNSALNQWVSKKRSRSLVSKTKCEPLFLESREEAWTENCL